MPSLTGSVVSSVCCVAFLAGFNFYKQTDPPSVSLQHLSLESADALEDELPVSRPSNLPDVVLTDIASNPSKVTKSSQDEPAVIDAQTHDILEENLTGPFSNENCSPGEPPSISQKEYDVSSESPIVAGPSELIQTSIVAKITDHEAIDAQDEEIGSIEEHNISREQGIVTDPSELTRTSSEENIILEFIGQEAIDAQTEENTSKEEHSIPREKAMATEPSKLSRTSFAEDATAEVADTIMTEPSEFTRATFLENVIPKSSDHEPIDAQGEWFFASMQGIQRSWLFVLALVVADVFLLRAVLSRLRAFCQRCRQRSPPTNVVAGENKEEAVVHQSQSYITAGENQKNDLEVLYDESATLHGAISTDRTNGRTGRANDVTAPRPKNLHRPWRNIEGRNAMEQSDEIASGETPSSAKNVPTPSSAKSDAGAGGSSENVSFSHVREETALGDLSIDTFGDQLSSSTNGNEDEGSGGLQGAGENEAGYIIKESWASAATLDKEKKSQGRDPDEISFIAAAARNAEMPSNPSCEERSDSKVTDFCENSQPSMQKHEEGFSDGSMPPSANVAEGGHSGQDVQGPSSPTAGKSNISGVDSQRPAFGDKAVEAPKVNARIARAFQLDEERQEAPKVNARIARAFQLDEDRQACLNKRPALRKKNVANNGSSTNGK